MRMGIFAKRDIAMNEELTFNYNVDRYGFVLPIPSNETITDDENLVMSLKNVIVENRIVLDSLVERLRRILVEWTNFTLMVCTLLILCD